MATELTWDLVADDHASEAFDRITKAADEAASAIRRCAEAIAELRNISIDVDLKAKDED